MVDGKKNHTTEEDSVFVWKRCHLQILFWEHSFSFIEKLDDMIQDWEVFFKGDKKLGRK